MTSVNAASCQNFCQKHHIPELFKNYTFPNIQGRHCIGLKCSHWLYFYCIMICLCGTDCVVVTGEGLSSTLSLYWVIRENISQIAKFIGPTWGPSGSCRPQMGPMLAPWTLLSGFTCIAQNSTSRRARVHGVRKLQIYPSSHSLQLRYIHFQFVNSNHYLDYRPAISIFVLCDAKRSLSVCFVGICTRCNVCNSQPMPSLPSR